MKTSRNRKGPAAGAALEKIERSLLGVWNLAQLWRWILRIESDLLPGFCAGFFLYPVDVGRPTAFRLRHPFVNWGTAADWRLPFERDHAVGYIKANPGCAPFRIADLFAHEKDWEATEFFRRICIPFGWYYRIVVPCWDKGRFIGAASFHRSREQGDHSQEECLMLARLQPRLQAATLRVLQTEATRLHLGCLKLSARSMAEARAVVRNDGEVVATGAWAYELEQWKRTMGFCAGRFPAELTQAIGRVAGGENAGEEVVRGGRCAEIHRVGGGNSLVHVALRRGGKELIPGRGTIPAACLTPAEWTVAELAAAGCSNKEIARTRESSVHTVRKQLSQIYAKLGIDGRYRLAGMICGK